MEGLRRVILHSGVYVRCDGAVRWSYGFISQALLLRIGCGFGCFGVMAVGEREAEWLP